MGRALIAGLLAFFVFACATRPAPKCFRMNVVVTAEDGKGNLVRPGVPVDVIVRSQRGRVLREERTDAEGRASFEICWRDDDRPEQIEARLNIGPQFVGTFASFFNYTDTYCLTLPNRIGGHCGEWGTGPK